MRGQGQKWEPTQSRNSGQGFVKVYQRPKVMIRLKMCSLRSEAHKISKND